MKDEINITKNDWKDAFKEELESRNDSFSKGTAKTFTWEETKQAAIAKVKAVKEIHDIHTERENKNGI